MWFKKALTVTPFDHKSFYAVVDPYDFYEYKHLQTIPIGTLFTKQLPPTEIVATGKIVISVKVDSSIFKRENNHFILQQAIDEVPTILLGQIPSAQELRSQYNHMQKERLVKISSFKENSKSLHFYVDADILYRVTSDNINAMVYNFGKIADVIETLEQHREKLKKESDTKKGRAHEMDLFMRYNNALSYIKALGLSYNNEKLNYLISEAKIEPRFQNKLSWEQCYYKFGDGAKRLVDRIQQLSCKAWLKST